MRKNYPSEHLSEDFQAVNTWSLVRCRKLKHSQPFYFVVYSSGSFLIVVVIRLPFNCIPLSLSCPFILFWFFFLPYLICHVWHLFVIPQLSLHSLQNLSMISMSVAASYGWLFWVWSYCCCYAKVIIGLFIKMWF